MKILKDKTYKRLIEDLEYHRKQNYDLWKENDTYYRQQMQIQRLIDSYKKTKDGK